MKSIFVFGIKIFNFRQIIRFWSIHNYSLRLEYKAE